MESKELLKQALMMGKMTVNDMVKDMTEDHHAVFPSQKGGCHALWVIGNLAYSEGYFIQEMVLEKENPVGKWKDKFGGGTEPVEDKSKYPAFSELLSKYNELREETLKILDGMSEEDLDQETKAEGEMKQWIGTKRQCLHLAAIHDQMHRGQLADARRSAGLKRVGH
jgi:hypothetical protein